MHSPDPRLEPLASRRRPRLPFDLLAVVLAKLVFGGLALYALWVVGRG
ncbi:MAG: hypothetical protein J0M21_12565 [Xanthomonadales bacterium]|nr:hypothetical protein [Xanthomonadales bacterium]